jgi:hypothetical protein
MQVRSTRSPRGVGWFVVMLRDHEAPRIVEVLDDFDRLIPGLKVFCPAVFEGLVDERTPISSYLFVQATIPPTRAVTLERSRFTRSVVRLPGSREAARITDEELGRMVIESPRPVLRTNQRVTVMTGDFAGLEGRVVGINSRMVRVEITLRSVVREIYISKAEVQQCGTTGTTFRTLD